MLSNVFPREEIVGLVRSRSKAIIQKRIHPADIEEHIKSGWEVIRQKKRSATVTKPKAKAVLLEDRVWTLFYKLGFDVLSGDKGAFLKINEDPDSPDNQIDCVAIDDATSLCIECKTSAEPRRDAAFQDKITKLAARRRAFSEATSKQFPSKNKRHVGMVIFTHDVIASEPDGKRAEDQNVVLLDERDLAHYEALQAHLGPAAKYQILADIFPGKQIHGLKITVPALQTKYGDYRCYTFSIHPEYLLKIAFVSHRAKGKGSSVDAYQRMIKRSRLRKIREYISEDGIFPTNIVLNIENSKYVRFDLGKQDGAPESARVGWLTLEPAFKSAWVIDGQHRLFAYSGHKRASTSYLSVVAFENLPGHMQAKLFVDINHEQKSVKRSLLDELWAELHWDAADPEKKIRAIISKAVQGLNDDKESPFYGRILLSDIEKTDRTCISLSSVLAALDKPGFFLDAMKKDLPHYGPLWAGKNEATVKRAQRILNCFFLEISTRSGGWWDKGSGEGGGLAMNDGVTIAINVLRSAMEHLRKQLPTLPQLTNDELAAKVQPFAIALGEHFGHMTDAERTAFRGNRGVQGQTAGTRLSQEAIQSTIPTFDPPGLSEFITNRKANTNEEARRLIEQIEISLQKAILSTLKQEFPNPDQWWFEGVPKAVRRKVDERVNDSDGKEGGREQNFDLIHYREIATHNWGQFESILGYKIHANKEKRTEWLADINAMRKIVMHPSKGQVLPVEKLSQLKAYNEWLHGKLSGSADSDQGELDETPQTS